jgi:hypothetical protein
MNNFTLCLLNGAFERHDSKPPYKVSRGLILLDFFKFNDVQRFVSEYDFSGIENFTLIIVDSKYDVSLFELRWDGSQLHKTNMAANEPHIWSSCTLYTSDAIKNRIEWFTEFLNKNSDFNKENCIEFHKNAGDGSLENSVMMNRDNKVKTVSITCIDHSDFSYTMDYLNTENMASSTIRIFKSDEKKSLVSEIF